MVKIGFKRRKALRRKSLPREIWDFLWNSNSIWSWVADLLILYLLVKLVFFPVMGFMIDSPLPSVIVESSSMYHAGNFENWWQEFGSWYEKHNISKEEIKKWPYSDGIDKGDIIIVSGRYKDRLKVGDVIVFDAGEKKPIIHRVIKISNFISTKGDNNIDQLAKEKDISNERIIGKAIARIPKAGWAKLVFVDIIKAIQ